LYYRVNLGVTAPPMHSQLALPGIEVVDAAVVPGENSQSL
jgi:hypothetical protein